MAISGTNLSPVNTPVVVPVPDFSPIATPAAVTATPDFVAPPVSDLPFPRLTLATLGLGLPNSQGDAAALFAQVSLALEQTIGDTRDNKLSGYAAALSSNLAALAAQLSRIADDQKKIVQTDANLAGLNAQRDPLVQARDSAQGSSNSLGTAIGADQASITALTNQLAGLKPGTPTYKAVEKQISDVKAHMAVLQGQKNGYDKIVSDKNAEIAPLDSQISTQNGIKAAVQGDISSAENLVQTTLDLLSQVLAGIPRSTRQTEQARDTVITRQFEDIFKNLQDSSSRADADKEIQTLAEQLGVKQSVVQKIVLAAFGLTAGIGNLVDSLRKLQPTPVSGLPDQASAINGRLQFAV